MEILGRTLTRRHVIKTCLGAAAAPLTAATGLDRDEPPLHFVARTIDGDKYTSETLKGKVVLIEFWATWCQYCKSDERAVENVIKDFESKGLLVLAVDMGEPKRKVKKYLEENPRSSKVVLAEDTTLAAICEAKAYPLYVLLDREGNIAGKRYGATGEHGLRMLLTRVGLEES